MKRLLLLFALIAMTVAAYADARFTNESLDYNISYKWGLVQKNAGTARLTLSVTPTSCRAKLVARTDPWADKFYKLRDTLTTTFSPITALPTEYVRIAHEDGSYAKDIVRFTRSGNSVTGDCTRWRKGKKATEITESSTTLHASGVTVDLVSSFYYLRTLDFAAMTKGQKTTVNIFSGKKKELLTIKYLGAEKIKINGKEWEAQKVSFTFTTDSQKESSDPIDAWISDDGRHIPLKIEGSLKIGKIRCIYSGT